MKNYKTELSSPEELAPLKQNFLKGLPLPKDGMWEAFVAMADHYAIKHDGKNIGYFVINPEMILLQFHVNSDHDTASIFTRILTEKNIKGAVPSTVELNFLSLCKDHQKQVTVNALMYHFEESSTLSKAAFAQETEFRLINNDELEVAVRFAHDTLGADQNWLTGYYGGLIKRGELFGLWQNRKLIATGECRLSDSQKPYADLGVVVCKKHRGEGLATEILRELLDQCRRRELKAICSTEQENIAAQKAITKAGFISHHKILEIDFQ